MLTKLKIKEVSSVNRGAGDDCKVVIMKRDDEDETPQRRSFREIFSGKTKAFGAGFRTNEEERRNLTGWQESHEPKEGDVVATRPILPVKLQGMVDAVRATRPDLSEEQVVHFLLHTGRGRSVAEHIASIIKSKDEPPMSRIEKLHSIAKEHGLVEIAKNMVAENDAYDVSEAEFTAMMNAEAARKGMSFAKYFEAPENVEVRKAWQLTKNTLVSKDTLLRPASLTPTQTFVGDTSLSLEDDSKEAIRLLTAMAEKQAAAGKYRSVHQAFLAVFQDAENAELAGRAHRRPNAADSGNYPFLR
jgi:hypothetical protein